MIALGVYEQEAPVTDSTTTQTMSFKAHQTFAEETRAWAKTSNKPLSEYIREAVQEKNERELAQRIRLLSERLSAKSLAENQAMDAVIGDGIA
jgi:hypothetical protein